MAISLQQLQQISSPRAAQFEKSLKRLKKHFERIKPQLFPEDASFYESYLAEGQTIIDNGLHDQSLIKAKWMNHNFRYGSHSIDGTLGEMLAVWIWNLNVFNTRIHVGPETKEAQMSGVDLVLTNPSWNMEVNVQVKLARIRGNDVTIPDNLERYDPRIVHRVMLIDPSSQKLITADLTQLVRLYYRDDVWHKSGKYIVPLEQVLKIPKATLFFSTQN